MRRILLILSLLILVGAGGLYFIYQAVMKPVIHSSSGNYVDIYLREATPFDSLLSSMEDGGIVSDTRLLKWLSKAMKVKNMVNPGYYKLSNRMSSLDLVRKIRSGSQDPIKLTFHGIRLREDLARRLDQQLALDSTQIMDLFRDDAFLAELGFRRDDALCVFIPNTYEVYWTISPGDLFKRMKKEYDIFWDEERKTKAAEAGLIPIEVSILASIVQEETNKRDEMSRVAGVYINRLNKGMKLQADPTTKFAAQNFGVRRVLESDLSVSSPYNTYLHIGLPPGPICLPEPQTLDKVLDYEKHDFIFMVARPDYSGYHNFSKGEEQHMANARAYRRFLNREGIYR